MGICHQGSHTRSASRWCVDLSGSLSPCCIFAETATRTGARKVSTPYGSAATQPEEPVGSCFASTGTTPRFRVLDSSCQRFRRRRATSSSPRGSAAFSRSVGEAGGARAGPGSVHGASYGTPQHSKGCDPAGTQRGPADELQAAENSLSTSCSQDCDSSEDRLRASDQRETVPLPLISTRSRSSKPMAGDQGLQEAECSSPSCKRSDQGGDRVIFSQCRDKGVRVPVYEASVSPVASECIPRRSLPGSHGFNTRPNAGAAPLAKSGGRLQGRSHGMCSSLNSLQLAAQLSRTRGVQKLSAGGAG